MSRLITAFPPLLVLATWWFITVSQSRSTLITSRFIRLGDAFRRSALLPFFAIGREWFLTCESGRFPFYAWAARGFKLNIYMRICKRICIYYCYMHIVIFLYMKHQQDRTSEVSYLDAKQKHLV